MKKLAMVALILTFGLFVSSLMLEQPQVVAASAAKSAVLAEDPEGWIWGGTIYYNPKDPRLNVPKLRGSGMTLNFANPFAWVVLVAIFVVVIVAKFLPKRKGK